MTVIETITDPEALTMTMVAQFDASPERIWELWEDPEQLGRWWGPAPFKATFSRHEFFPGGESRYVMSGPDGYAQYGWWRIAAVDRLSRVDFANGLAGDDGEPTPELPPMIGYATFEAVDGGTRMTAFTQFIAASQMEAMLARGMEAGMAAAIGQIDGLL